MRIIQSTIDMRGYADMGADTPVDSAEQNGEQAGMFMKIGRRG